MADNENPDVVAMRTLETKITETIRGMMDEGHRFSDMMIIHVFLRHLTAIIKLEKGLPVPLKLALVLARLRAAVDDADVEVFEMDLSGDEKEDVN